MGYHTRRPRALKLSEPRIHPQTRPSCNSTVSVTTLIEEAGFKKFRVDTFKTIEFQRFDVVVSENEVGFQSRKKKFLAKKKAGWIAVIFNLPLTSNKYGSSNLPVLWLLSNDGVFEMLGRPV